MSVPGPRLVLVGPPGAGKSTVGRAVARHLAVGFRDTDADVEQRVGKSISDVFLEDGEPAFRALEHEAVVTALAEHDGVLALGGGAVLDARTREALRGRPVVFLSVGLVDAVARVGLSTARPVLALNPRATLKVLLDERRPLYEEVARARVDTDRKDVAAVVQEVLDALEPQDVHP